MRLIALLLLLITGCACHGQNLPKPDFHTSLGIPVKLRIAPESQTVADVAEYLDACQQWLQWAGEDVPETLVVVDGNHRLSSSNNCKITVGWRDMHGAKSYAHERLHQAGWSETKILGSGLPDEAHDYAVRQTFGLH